LFAAAASDAPTADALTFRTYTNVNANETRVVLCGVGPKDTIVLVVHSHSALEFLVVPYLHEKRAAVLEDAAWTAGPCRDPENMLLGKQEVLDVSDGDGNCVVADVELTTGKIELGVAIAPDYMVRWSEDKLAFRTDTVRARRRCTAHPLASRRGCCARTWLPTRPRCTTVSTAAKSGPAAAECKARVRLDVRMHDIHVPRKNVPAAMTCVRSRVRSCREALPPSQCHWCPQRRRVRLGSRRARPVRHERRSERRRER
jgi:hypothetical protein